MARPRLLLTLMAAALATGPAGAGTDARADLRRAVTAFRLGNVGVASAAAAQAVAAAPGDPLAQAMQARVAIAQYDGVLAEAALDRAQRAGMDARRLLHLRAHAKLLQGDTDAAAELAASPLIPARYRGYALRIAGRVAFVTDDIDGARADFARAVRLFPGDTMVWSDLARFRMMTGDQVGAGQAVDRAIAASARNGEALVLKGEITRRVYGLAAALPWFEAAIDLDPTDGQAQVEYAATLGDMGRYGEMLAAARMAATQRASRAQALYLQAVLAARAQNYDLARDVLQRAGDALDETPAVLLLAGGLDYQARAFDQAADKLGRLVAQQPGNADARRLLGAALLGAGDARGALDALAPLVERPAPDGYAATLAARALEKLGDRDKAGALIDLASRSVARSVGGVSSVAAARSRAAENSGSADAWAALGDALIAAGNPRGAADSYARAANLRFDEASALRLVDALERAGAHDDAAETLDLFLQQNPANIAALRLAADWQIAAEEWPEAVRTLEALRQRLGNRDAALLAQLAWAHAGAGDAARALVFAEAAYELAPGSPLAADTYGWLLAADPSRLTDAHALLAKAAAIAPGNRAIARHLAIVSERRRRG